MRKEKKLEVLNREVTIRELKNKHIKELILSMTPESEEANMSILDFVQTRIGKYLPWCSDLTLEEFDEMTPGETLEIWAAFQEVNAAFFGIAQSLNLGAILKGIKSGIEATFWQNFARALPGASGSATGTHGTTDGGLPVSA